MTNPKTITIGNTTVRLTSIMSVCVLEPCPMANGDNWPWRVSVLSEALPLGLELEFAAFTSDGEEDLEASEEQAREEHAEIVKQWEAALEDDTP